MMQNQRLKKFEESSLFLFSFLYINARGMEIKFFQPSEISHMKDSQKWAQNSLNILWGFFLCLSAFIS